MSQCYQSSPCLTFRARIRGRWWAGVYMPFIKWHQFGDVDVETAKEQDACREAEESEDHGHAQVGEGRRKRPSSPVADCPAPQVVAAPRNFYHMS